MKNEKYNGWKNYETFTIASWICENIAYYATIDKYTKENEPSAEKLAKFIKSLRHHQYV